MYSNAKQDCLIRTMSYLESRHFIEEVERHVADLYNVLTSIWLGQSADYHVCVADGLNLQSFENATVLRKRQLSPVFEIFSESGFEKFVVELELEQSQ